MTSLIRWDPHAELNSLHDRVNTLFNDMFGSFGSTSLGAATDISSDDKGLTIEVHLPHFKEDEISVNMNDDLLEVKAEHQEKAEDKKDQRNYLVRESVSQYYRRFTLPKNADIDKIDARLENGVLSLHIPYKELPAPKRIAITAKNKSAK